MIFQDPGELQHYSHTACVIVRPWCTGHGIKMSTHDDSCVPIRPGSSRDHVLKRGSLDSKVMKLDFVTEIGQSLLHVGKYFGQVLVT